MTFRAWFVCVVILNKAPKRRNWRRGKSEQRGPTKVSYVLQIKAFDNFPKSKKFTVEAVFQLPAGTECRNT